MFRLSLETELSAAREIALKVGLEGATPELLHVGNHTSVRLAPWPFVARIASGTSFDFSSNGLALELRVGAHLQSRGAPAACPATTVDPGPHVEQNCAITLWDFVDGRPIEGPGDEHIAARALGLVHHALSDIPLDLPSYLEKVESCEEILGDPAQAPELAAADRRFLSSLYGRLRERLPTRAEAWQPLHGDTHVGNVRISGARAIWMDLESACLGPLEWDVVNLPRQTWSQFPKLDNDLLHLFADVRSLCIATWCWAEFERSDACREAAAFHLRELKQGFA